MWYRRGGCVGGTWCPRNFHLVVYHPEGIVSSVRVWSMAVVGGYKSVGLIVRDDTDTTFVGDCAYCGLVRIRMEDRFNFRVNGVWIGNFGITSEHFTFGDNSTRFSAS
eukprot:PhF_6_TR483/c0_g1_i1/m.227